VASVGERVEDLRERHAAVDRVVRMQQHYGAANAGQQAGAITYFAFLSFFPVLALAFFTVGLLSTVLDGADVTLRSAVTSLFPGMIGPDEGQLQLRDFRDFSGLAGLLGLAGVLYSGLGWVSALRQALNTVFEVPEDEQLGFVPGKLRDLVALVSIGLTLLVAVGVSGLVSGFSADLLGWAGLDEELSWAVQLLTVALGLAANAVLFFTMFRLLGGEHVPRRSLVSGAVLGAVVFEVLKRAAGLIIAQTQGQPAFQAFGIALVMLVWISYFSRLVLYAACWAWTSPEAREARAREAALEPVAPVQGPALPSGEDAVLLAAVEDAETAHERSSPLKPFAAGAAAALGVAAVSRRRKGDT
jgi:membrane protein